MQVREYLDSEHVDYEAIPHRRTYSAMRLAESVCESGEIVAKSVVVEADGKPYLVVLPATHFVDLAATRNRLGATTVKLAPEARCRDLYPDCEVGAMAPFGSRQGLRTIVDRSLCYQHDIIFESNRHDEAIRMHFSDYERLETPIIADVSRHS